MGEVPEELRGAVSAELAALVVGDRPKHLTWVTEYGERGATLVTQPPAIWTHQRTDVIRTDDGGWHVVVPLWITEEQPSDLSAELVIGPDGTTTLTDIRVL